YGKGLGLGLAFVDVVGVDGATLETSTHGDPFATTQMIQLATVGAHGVGAAVIAAHPGITRTLIHIQHHATNAGVGPPVVIVVTVAVTIAGTIVVAVTVVPIPTIVATVVVTAIMTTVAITV